MVKLPLRPRAGRQFLKSGTGSVLVYTAFAVPIFLGVAGLAVDISAWHAHKRSVQNIADSGAAAGANELIRLIDVTTRVTDAETAATADATTNGLKGADFIDINIPPESGNFAGATNAVEVIVRRPVPTFLAGLVFKGQASVTARAVSSVEYGQYCVMALNSSSPNALKVSGGANLNLNCGVAVNSGASNPDYALSSPGGGCISATVIKVVGDSHPSGCYNPVAPFEGTLPSTNPYEGDYAEPPEASEACNPSGNLTVHGGDDVTLPAGNHCNSVTVQNGGTLRLGEGTHVFGKGFTVHGQVVEEAGSTGVTFYLPDSTGNSDKINFASDADVHISAPDAGDYAGLLIYVDEGASGNVTHNLTAQTTSTLEGLIYMPTHDVKFSGGAATEGVMLIADEIELSGQANFDNLGTLPQFDDQAEMKAKIVE